MPTLNKRNAVLLALLLPLLMGGRRPGVRRSLPRIGEHTDEVLGSLATRRQSA